MRVPVFEIFRAEAGATAIEYAFVASLISMVAYASVSSIGAFVSNTFSTIAGGM